MESVFDTAITDFYLNKATALLIINNHYGQADEMPLTVYFRSEEDLNIKFIWVHTDILLFLVRSIMI